jgi:hypothetical protein
MPRLRWRSRAPIAGGNDAGLRDLGERLTASGLDGVGNDCFPLLPRLK